MTTQLRLQCIKAVAHPLGNRIDLQWFNPQPDQFDGVLVRRKQATYPVSEKKGEEVKEPENPVPFNVDLNFKNELDNKILSPDLSACFLSNEIILSGQAVVFPVVQGSRWHIRDGELIYLIVDSNGALDVYGMSLLEDTGLRAETVYYYAFFPYKNDPLDSTKKKYIYDRRNRVSAMATGPYDFAGQVYRMLPAIYHRYDTVLPQEKYRDRMSEEDMKRGQLRRFLDLPASQLDQLYSFATAALDFHNLYRVDGKLLPLLAQWIGWETDYNLEISHQRSELRNAPALYKTIGIIPTIEVAIAKCIKNWDCLTKEFVHNVFLSNRPEQLNLWLCEPKQNSNPPGQWQESKQPLSLDYAYEGRPAAEWEGDTLWLFYHTHMNNRWNIWFKTYQKNGEWSPSQPFTTGDTIDKHPTAALQDNTLWVFWNSCNQADQTWGIYFRKQINGEWSEISSLDNDIPNPGNPRKSPQAVVDQLNRLWLFWLEKTGMQWQLKYNRHNRTAWELTTPVDFPLDGGNDPRVEKDLFVLFHSTESNHHIWVFWAQKRYIGDNGQRYWQIVFRKKSGIESIEGDWESVEELPKVGPKGNYHDCEPAAIVNADGDIELFWASNRMGSWSIWNIKLKDIASGSLDTAEMVIKNLYSQRTPLPFRINNEISLVYRSNQSLTYESDVYGATGTTDFRYAGSTTVDVRNTSKIKLRGNFQDFQTYTYDTGENGTPTDDDWYARDTIGLYLTPDTEDPQLVTRNREYVKEVLDRFLPIQTRAVLIINPAVYKELVYTYDFPKENEENPRHIEEQFEDQITIGAIPEVCPGVSDTYEDKVPEWTWFRSVKVEYIEGQEHVEYTDHRTVNVDVTPIDTGFRTWHIGVNK